MPTPHPPAPSRFAGTLASGRPLVSVIIPTYNRAPLLKTAITSALNQEQAGELFDVEVIVVDDCSPQDMSPIVAAFPGVRYLRLPENRGASGARNAGIKEARGKYVALLDDDDEFLTHKLMIQVPLLEASPDIGVVYGQSVVTGSDTPLLLWPEWAPSGQVFEEFLTRTEDFLHPPTWLVRRELFEAAGWFNEQHRTMEHYDMALRLSMLASWTFLSGGPVARGRFSKKGKWYSNIVNGTNEQRLPRIVESALSRLPATPEAERIRCKARAAVCATIAGQRWWTGGGLEPTKQHLLSSLRTSPWLLRETPVMEWIQRIAGTLAGGSHQPVQAVRAFWEEIKQATSGSPDARTIQMRGVLGEMLSGAAISMKQGSPRRAWMVGLGAIVHNPKSLQQPTRLLHLYRALAANQPSAGTRLPLSPS
ncbi:MAG: Glycotrans2-like domain-containing protein [Nitrospira sp.]|nr:MAG: Glycotrans2-like domain-containing protein [Nitrospira sp.]